MLKNIKKGLLYTENSKKPCFSENSTPQTFSDRLRGGGWGEPPKHPHAHVWLEANKNTFYQTKYELYMTFMFIVYTTY